MKTHAPISEVLIRSCSEKDKFVITNADGKAQLTPFS